MTRSKTRLGQHNDKEPTCQQCRKKCLEEDNETIECDTCHSWFHRNCLDKTFTKAEWEFMTKDNQYVMFKCMACIQDRGERVSEMREIKEMLNENLTKMFKNLETELYSKLDKAVEGKIKEMINRQDSFEQRFEKAEKKSTENENKYEQRFKLIEQKLNEKHKNTNPEQLENMIKEVKATEINLETKIKDQVGIYLDNKEVKERKKMNLIIQRLAETEEKEEDQKSKDVEDI